RTLIFKFGHPTISPRDIFRKFYIEAGVSPGTLDPSITVILMQGSFFSSDAQHALREESQIHYLCKFLSFLPEIKEMLLCMQCCDDRSILAPALLTSLIKAITVVVAQQYTINPGQICKSTAMLVIRVVVMPGPRWTWSLA